MNLVDIDMHGVSALCSSRMCITDWKSSPHIAARVILVSAQLILPYAKSQLAELSPAVMVSLSSSVDWP